MNKSRWQDCVRTLMREIHVIICSEVNKVAEGVW
jgi:hypothetical protein